MSNAVEEQHPSPFQNRNFLMLYCGQAVSLFGDWFKTIALIGIVYSLVPTASSVGGMFIASVLPVMFGGILMGPLVDKFNKKKILLLVDLLRALFTLGIIFGAVIGNIWVVYAFIALSSFASSAFGPARQSMIPEILKEKNLIQATSSFAMLTSFTMVVASALGGVLADWLGATTILYFDAFSYLVSAAFVLMIRYTPKEKPDAPKRLPYMQQVREGLQFVRNSPQLTTVFWLQAWRDFALGFVYILFSLYVLEELGKGNTGVGIGYAVTAVAYLIGAFFIKQYFKRKKFDNGAFFKIYFPFNMLYGIGLGVMFSIPDWYLFLAVLLIANIFQQGVNVITETSLMTYSKPEVRGRVFASFLSASRLAYGISLPLFSAIGGFIPSHIGGYILTAVVVTSSLILTVWLRGKLRTLQTLEEQTTSV